VKTTRIAALALAAGALLPPAAAQAYDAAVRPHAAVVLRDRGVAVARLDAAGRLSHGRLALHVTLTARSRPGAARRYVLRAGACRGANTGHVACPPSFSRAVTLSAQRTTILAVDARLRISSGPRRAALVTLTAATARPPSRRGAQSPVASLLLPDRAWRAYPGRRFGLRVYRPWEGSPVDVRSVTADATQLSPAAIWPVLGWSLRTDRSVVVTTIASACGGLAACPQQATTQTVGAPGARFAGRPSLQRSRPGYWSFFARSADGALFNATMPWAV
jgi:hypothetical protein